MNAQEEKILSELKNAIHKVYEPAPVRRVQMKYVEFKEGVSVCGTSITSFQHGATGLLPECWLVDDEFILVSKHGEQGVVPKSFTKCWTALEDIDWLSEEPNMTPEKRAQLKKMKAAK